MSIENFAVTVMENNGYIWGTLNYWQNWPPFQGIARLNDKFEDFTDDYEVDWGSFVTECTQFASGFTLYYSVRIKDNA